MSIELLTVQRAAEYLNIPLKPGSKTDNRVKTLYNLIAAGKKGKKNGIPTRCYKKIGKTIMFIKSRLDEWILSEDSTENINSQDVA